MKKLSFLLMLACATGAASAQNTFPATGNVGIGTSTPAYNLDVSSSGNTTLQLKSTTATTGYSDMIFKGSLDFWKISKFPSGTNPSSHSGTMGFTYNNGAYGGDKPIMTMYAQYGSNPRVYIGTNSMESFGGAMFAVNGEMRATKLVLSSNNSTNFGSTCLLSVDGKIGAREVIVSTATPFPDYVFTQNYKLLTLQEIEKHIKENSRLPKMPSAAEVEKSGMELGKLNTLLVEKIEELTLHLIELNKKVEKLEKESILRKK